MHLKTLSGLLLCLLVFAGTLAAQVNQSIVPEKIVIGVEPDGDVLQFTVAVNTPVPVSAGVQLPEEYYVLSLAAAPELSASVSASVAFPAATNPQRIVLLQEDGTIAEICCDDLPPIGAWLGGTIRVGFEQLRYSIWRNQQIVFKAVDPATIPYRRYAAVENRIGFEVVYEEYVEEPSYIAKTGHTVAAGLDLAVVIPSSGAVSTMMAKVPKIVTVDAIKEIAAKYGVFECMECAEEIIAAFKKAGVSGRIIDIDVPVNFLPSRGGLWSDRAGQLISENGRHRAVLVDGMVYDNIHKSGIKYEEWLKDIVTPFYLDLKDYIKFTDF